MNKRMFEVADYMIRYQTTIRKTAKEFGVSKSTIHKDITRLRSVNYSKFRRVQRLLKDNFDKKHIRGGEATRQKYTKRNGVV